MIPPHPPADVAPVTAAPARVVSERLVSMKDHNYKLEPNVTFTPDQKWIVFRSNMHGGTQVYAVEIAKAK